MTREALLQKATPIAENFARSIPLPHEDTETRLRHKQLLAEALRELLADFCLSELAAQASDCCGDAHMELEAMRTHFSALGLTEAVRHENGCKITTWTNALADAKNDEIEKLRKALVRVMADGRTIRQWITSKQFDGEAASVLLCNAEDDIRAALQREGPEKKL